MQIQRSLGGIGRLYRHDTLLGEVYYSVKQNQTDGSIYGSIVCVGQDVDLPIDDQSYCLLLEDARSLIVSLMRDSKTPFAPYSFTSRDGIIHSASSPPISLSISSS